MPAVAPAHFGQPAAPDPAAKAKTAARQFEAILLNTLFGALEHSFSALPGKPADPIGDNYHSLGMQALAAGVAAHGGLGIADRIARNLLKNSNQEAEPPGSTT